MEKCVEIAARRHWALPDIIDSEVLAKTFIADLTSNYWRAEFDKLQADDLGVDLRHIAARRRHFKATNGAVQDFARPRGIYWWSDVTGKVEFSGHFPNEAADEPMRDVAEGVAEGGNGGSDDEEPTDADAEGTPEDEDPEIIEIKQ